MKTLRFCDLFINIPPSFVENIISEVIVKLKMIAYESYAGNCSRLFSGYRSIKTVPLVLLKKQIEKDIEHDNSLASAAVRSWFELNDLKVQNIAATLRERGYSPQIPDFSKGLLKLTSLNSEDVIVFENLSFYKGNDSDSSPEKRLEQTVIAAFLGYVPFTFPEEDETDEVEEIDRSDDQQLKQPSEEKSILSASAQSNDIKQESVREPASSEAGEVLGHSAAVNQLSSYDHQHEDYSFYETVDLLQSSLEDYVIIKEQLISGLEKSKNNLLSDSLAPAEIPDYGGLQRSHDEILRLNKILTDLLPQFAAELHLEEKFGALLSNPPVSFLDMGTRLCVVYKEIADLINHRAQLLFENLESLLAEHAVSADNFLPSKSSYEGIKFRLSESKCLIKDIKLLDSWMAEFNNKLLPNSIKNAILDYSTSGSGFAESQIKKFFLQNGCREDLLLLIALIVKNKYSLGMGFKQMITECLSSQECLMDEFLIALLGDENFIKSLTLSEWESRRFVIIALNLFLRKRKNVSFTILSNIHPNAVISDYPELQSCVEKIFGDDQVRFLEQSLHTSDHYVSLINSMILKGEEYKKLSNGLDVPYLNALNGEFLPVLKDLFSGVMSEEIPRIKKTVSELTIEDYYEKLYKEVKKKHPKLGHHLYDKRLSSSIKNILVALTYHGKMRTEVLQQKAEGAIDGIRFTEQYRALTESFGWSYDNFSIDELLRSYLAAPDADEVSNVDEVILQKLHKSTFYLRYCPELFWLTNSQLQPSYQQLFECLIDSFDEQRHAEDVIAYLDLKNLHNLSMLLTQGKDDETRSQIIKKKIETIRKNQQTIDEKISSVDYDYNKLFAQGRYQLLLEKQNEKLREIEETQKKSLSVMENELDQLHDQLLELKKQYKRKKTEYLPEIMQNIWKALRYCEEICEDATIEKTETAKAMMAELQTLLNFPAESVDVLVQLMDDLEHAQEESTVSPDGYLQYSPANLVDIIESDDHQIIGISRRDWTEISNNRKSLMTDLLTHWETVKHISTTKEDLQHDASKFYERLKSLQLIARNFCDICSLYKSNHKGKLDKDLFQDWENTNDVPFFFVTRLQMPRCHSLDQPIRIFILSQKQLNKKSFNKIKDYITADETPKLTFNLLMVIGSKADLVTVVNPVTKNYPVIDEDQLKRIIFSTSNNKPPKWVFASVLTLNSPIASIQPFHYSGSVSRNTGIFVCRENLINEIVSNKKDFAVYGGRKIGKTSLLTEIANKLQQDGVIVIFQSFQGSDSQSIAKGIMFELKESRAFTDKAAYEFEDLTTFKSNLKRLYVSAKDKQVVIILDELDELIAQEKDLDEHKLIEVFRAISTETQHQWRFIFAGYKEMYKEIHVRGKYESILNPWVNFVDDSSKQLSVLESPRELVREGLRNILGLEYESEVEAKIIEYSTGHPAFLQKFCERLVKSVDKKISAVSRTITIKDVDYIFSEDNEFITFVKETLNQNLSDLQRAIVYIAAIEQCSSFTANWIKEKIEYWLSEFEVSKKIPVSEIKLEIELLSITNVIRMSKHDHTYEFAQPYYIKILNTIDNVDKDYIEELLKAL